MKMIITSIGAIGGSPGGGGMGSSYQSDWGAINKELDAAVGGPAYGGGGSDGSDRIKQQIEEERIRAEAEKAAREKQIKAEAEERVRQEAIQKEADRREAEARERSKGYYNQLMNMGGGDIGLDLGSNLISQEQMDSEIGESLKQLINERKNAIETGGKIGGVVGKLTLGSLGENILSKLGEWLTAKNIPEPTKRMALNALINYNADPELIKEAIERDYSGSGGGGGGSGSGGSVEATGGVGSPGTAGPAGATAGGATNYDPTTYEFWDSFVDEWMGKAGKSAKEQILEDDAFRKEKLEPAFGSYQQLLADLSNQAKTGTGQFAPTTFGMGNFRSSFVPRSQLMTADNLLRYGKEGLTSDLAATDVLQPNRGSREYLTELMKLAEYDRNRREAVMLAEKGISLDQQRLDYETEDKGTWLDAIKDIVQIGDTVGDTINKYWP